MIEHIDVSLVLRRTVCELYSNLVTRPTGRAVRGEIEQQIARNTPLTLTVIDFANVSLLDFSCADEVVAKLILKYSGPGAVDEAYFLFRGINDSHLDPIEAVLERHGIAIVAERTAGDIHLIGCLTDEERTAWDAVRHRRRVAANDASSLFRPAGGEPLSLLETLRSRRLVMRCDDEYVALGELLA